MLSLQITYHKLSEIQLEKRSVIFLEPALVDPFYQKMLSHAFEVGFNLAQVEPFFGLMFLDVGFPSFRAVCVMRISTRGFRRIGRLTKVGDIHVYLFKSEIKVNKTWHRCELAFFVGIVPSGRFDYMIFIDYFLPEVDPYVLLVNPEIVQLAALWVTGLAERPY